MPVAASGLLFFLVQPVLADLPSPRPATTNLPVSQLKIGTELIDGFNQVYYQTEDVRSYVSKGKHNHFNPTGQGSYLVWEVDAHGGTQIEMYNLSTGVLTSLATTGTHKHPSVDNGKAVWQTWIGDKWQIQLYDGFSTAMLPASETSVRPFIYGTTIAYAVRTDKDWFVNTYDMSTAETSSIKYNSPHGQPWPTIIDGTLYLDISHWLSIMKII